MNTNWSNVPTHRQYGRITATIAVDLRDLIALKMSVYYT